MTERIRYEVRDGRGMSVLHTVDGEYAQTVARGCAKRRPGDTYKVIKVVETEIYSTRNEA